MDAELDPALARVFCSAPSLCSAFFFSTAVAGSDMEEELDDSCSSGLLCVEEASDDCSSSECPPGMVGSVEVGGALAETLDNGGIRMCETLMSLFVSTALRSSGRPSEGKAGIAGKASTGSAAVSPDDAWSSASCTRRRSPSAIPKPFTVFGSREGSAPFAFGRRGFVVSREIKADTDKRMR